MTPMLNLLRRRPAFRRLWIAETLSLLGDWLSWVAVSVLALDHGGAAGGLAVAMVFVAHNLPHTLLSPVSGWVADRFDRRSILLWGHVLQTLLTVGMAVLAWTGDFWSLQVLLWARAAVSAIDLPARTAAVSRVVERDELLTAHTLTSATWSAAFALGMGLGGVIATAGAVPALLLDALTFAIAGLMLVGLPRLPSEGKVASYSWSPALSALRDDPTLLQAALAKTPLALAGGGGLVAMALLAEQQPLLGTAAMTLGTLQLLKGVGTGIGPMLARPFALRSAAKVLVAANLATFAAILLFATHIFAPALLLASLVWGMGTGSNWVLSTATLQQRVHSDLVGRLSALDGFFSTLGLCLAALLGGYAADVNAGDLGWAVGPGLTAGLLLWSGLRLLAFSAPGAKTPLAT